MQRFLLAAVLSSSAFIISTTPALAFAVEPADTICPIEVIGEAELNNWASSLVESRGEMSDAQANALGAAVATCAEKHGWNESDIESAVEFNLSIIAGTAIGDKLTEDGIDAVGYEVVLDNRSAEELQQLLNDPDNSPALKELTDRLVADFGNELTDEITAGVAAYIAFMAQSQFAAMKMMGLAE
jgi:hypothetical protein